MPEIPEHDSEALEAENAQLRKDNQRLRAENNSLKDQIVAMREQEASTTALFRVVQPTIGDRRARAQQTTHNPHYPEQ